MEQRNQFPSRSTTVVLRVNKCVVVDWESHWIGGTSIVVLDSVPQYPAGRNYGLDELRRLPHDRAGARGSAHRSTSAAGFPSAECFLCNEQRCAVAHLLRRVVSLHFAVAANEHPKHSACSGHGLVDCLHIHDETFELTADRSRADNHRCQACGNYSTNAS